jgi:hypothetical protein
METVHERFLFVPINEISATLTTKHQEYIIKKRPPEGSAKIRRCVDESSDRDFSSFKLRDGVSRSVFQLVINF